MNNNIIGTRVEIIFYGLIVVISATTLQITPLQQRLSIGNITVLL